MVATFGQEGDIKCHRPCRPAGPERAGQMKWLSLWAAHGNVCFAWSGECARWTNSYVAIMPTRLRVVYPYSVYAQECNQHMERWGTLKCHRSSRPSVHEQSGHMKWYSLETVNGNVFLPTQQVCKRNKYNRGHYVNQAENCVSIFSYC